MATAHEVGGHWLRTAAPPTFLRPLWDALAPHLTVAIGALERHGYDPRRDWPALAPEIYSTDSPTLLHGDLVVGNVIRDAVDGGLLLLDTCGYLGPREFDAARWAARSGGAAESAETLSAWLKVEAGLEPRRAHALLALELAMQAGVRELVKEERGVLWQDHDDMTEQLLQAAEDLLPKQRAV